MFSFFRKKAPAPATPVANDAPAPSDAGVLAPAPEASSVVAPSTQASPASAASTSASPASASPTLAPPPPEAATPAPPEPGRAGWMQRLRQGLRKTSTGIAQVFTGVRIDEALYEELESGDATMNNWA